MDGTLIQLLQRQANTSLPNPQPMKMIRLKLNPPRAPPPVESHNLKINFDSDTSMSSDSELDSSISESESDEYSHLQTINNHSKGSHHTRDYTNTQHSSASKLKNSKSKDSLHNNPSRGCNLQKCKSVECTSRFTVFVVEYVMPVPTLLNILKNVAHFSKVHHQALFNIESLEISNVVLYYEHDPVHGFDTLYNPRSNSQRLFFVMKFNKQINVTIKKINEIIKQMPEYIGLRHFSGPHRVQSINQVSSSFNLPRWIKVDFGANGYPSNLNNASEFIQYQFEK
ncbi:hypothetical protein HK098_006757 [Nowakowskiella sp. JEL0407]|nr:hypothetical protein HK098_006757 [Nowakowskiella sp. JEL0407]